MGGPYFHHVILSQEHEIQLVFWVNKWFNLNWHSSECPFNTHFHNHSQRYALWTNLENIKLKLRSQKAEFHLKAVLTRSDPSHHQSGDNWDRRFRPWLDLTRSQAQLSEAKLGWDPDVEDLGGQSSVRISGLSDWPATSQDLSAQAASPHRP